jgi:hypothetical protein
MDIKDVGYIVETLIYLIIYFMDYYVLWWWDGEK